MEGKGKRKASTILDLDLYTVLTVLWSTRLMQEPIHQNVDILVFRLRRCAHFFLEDSSIELRCELLSPGDHSS